MTSTSPSAASTPSTACTIDLHAGEVVGLVGGNGAGKTTLMRVLSGAHPADSGEILIDGGAAAIRNTRDAKNLQIETHLPDAGARGQHRCAWQRLPGPRAHDAAGGTLDDGAMEDATREGHGPPEPELHATSARRSKSLSGGQRQAVAIARAVHFNARILIMDEPTAALGPAETAQVRDLIRQLKSEGPRASSSSATTSTTSSTSRTASRSCTTAGIVGIVDKADVTTDEVLGMIILGKPLEKLTEKEIAELRV